MRRKIFMISGLILLFSVSLAGATSAAQETIEITSSSIRIDYDSGAVYCKGDAKAVWGGVIMEADEMQIFLTEENTVEKIEARGNVKVIQEEGKRQAGCEMAIYTAEDDKFVLEIKAYYYDESGKGITKTIDYSIGHVMRTPDHDERVQNPFRPMSIVVDCIK